MNNIVEPPKKYHSHTLPPANDFRVGTLAQCSTCPKWFKRYTLMDEYIPPSPVWGQIYWFQFGKRSRIKKAGFSWR